MMTETAAGSTRRFRFSANAGLVGTWVLLIVAGTLALRLPVCAAGSPLSWIDSAFTATSAVCVTGLSTVSISDQLSFTGQIVLLVLIQLGGLGIGTVSTFLLLSAGRAGVAEHVGAEESLACLQERPLRLVRRAVVITLSLEAIGAVLLAARFGGPHGWWNGVFHSVSAFCNAGFSLFPQSLGECRNDAVINGILAVLIVLGGLGFIVHVQFANWIARRRNGRRTHLPLHARTVLWVNLVLWTAGVLMFLVMENNGVLKPLAAGEKLVASVFQSVTLRTAGFSTLDFGQMREATLAFCMLLMLIGAAPGSCGGGLKVTTAAVLAAVALARLRGAQAVSLLRRTMPPETVMRAFALLTLSLFFLAWVVFALLITETEPGTQGRSHDRLTSLAFEAVSAFGTVGLSTGVTGGLSALGKALVIVTMFIGRLGPLAVGLAVLGAPRRQLYQYPTEPVAIG